MFITFEGIEGSGKTSLIAGLALELRSIGADVFVTREPGGTAFGDAVRKIFVDPGARIEPLAEAFLMNASRAQLVAERIAPMLKTGAIILCDRFFDATVAYQGYGRGLDIEMLIRLSLVASQSIAPDMTFLIDVEPRVSRARVDARGVADRLEREDDGFHERVRQGYLELARRFDRIVILNGSESPEHLIAQALQIIVRRRYTIAL
ncbi:MAG: dTMP kinase [Candidatus Velthaea sp.]